MTYTFVGSHPDSLASGRPLTFGDTVDKVDKADQRLVDSGVLVADPAPAPAPAPAPTPSTDGKPA